MEPSLSIFVDSLLTVGEFLLLDERRLALRSVTGWRWTLFVLGGGEVSLGGEDGEMERGLKKVDRRDTASGWKVIQGGGEEATHI